MSALNCGCRKELEAKLTERFKDQKPEGTDHSVSLDGYGLGITSTGVVVNGMMPYRAEATFTSKAGKTSRKTIKGNMIFSYCPFCGKKGDTP